MVINVHNLFLLIVVDIHQRIVSTMMIIPILSFKISVLVHPMVSYDVIKNHLYYVIIRYRVRFILPKSTNHATMVWMIIIITRS